MNTAGECGRRGRGGSTMKNPACVPDRVLKFMVARTRFELVISALRGRCPKPLDERAILSMRFVKWLGWKESNPHMRYQKPVSYH